MSTRAQRDGNYLSFRKLSIIGLLHVGEGYIFWNENWRAIRVNASREGTILGRKFATRTLKNGILVWRKS